MTALAETLFDGGTTAVQVLGRHYTRLIGRVVPYDQPTIVGPYVESWQRGAFTRSLSRQSRLPLLAYHQSSSTPLGVADAWDDQPDGLYGAFRLLTTATAQQAAAYAEDRIVFGLSIGFVGEASEWRYASTYAPDLGVDYMDSVTRTQARLVEVSLVSTPAFVGAVVTSVESEAL